MARFYFDQDHWGATFEEHDGFDGPELDVARQCATYSALAFMRSEAAEGRSCPGCCIDVARVAGASVITVVPLAAGRARVAR